MRNAWRRPGFTLVELLAVIAIIAILLALLMPAVQGARESARRSTCSGNVRQIASALQTYEHSQGSLPPGIKARLRWSDWVRDPTRDDLGYEWTYFLHYLLPHAEQLQLFEVLRGPEFDINNPWESSATAWPPALAAARNIPLYRCPSDAAAGFFTLWGSQPTWKSNYLGFFSGLRDGDTESAANWCAAQPAPPPGQSAVFKYGFGVKMANIRDGLGSTMAIGEYLTGLGEQDTRGWFWTNRAGSQHLHVTLTPNSSAADVSIDHPGFCPSTGEYNRPAQNLPCTRADLCGVNTYASPRSRHSGGVMVGFCDGSSRFIADSIDLAPWRNLGWMNDGKAGPEELP